ncbi:MAG TPA: thioredoxin domain-containing protein [Pyrinomonadaceae bacterium]
MKTAIGPLVLMIVVTSAVYAQKTQRGTIRRRPPTATSPQPSPTPAAPMVASTPTPTPNRPPAAPVPLVTINGQTITTADLDPSLRAQLETVEDKVVEAKRGLLDMQINTLLLEAEARRRGITTHQLYETEVSKRNQPATPAQVKQFLTDNKEQFAGMDAATANEQAVAIIHDELESRLSDALITRLRKTTPVVMGVDVTQPNLSPDAVVATIGGNPVKAAPLIERFKPVVYQMRNDAYQIEKGQADRMVDDLLLIAEANKRNVGSEEIVRTEISEKIHTPSDAEVAKFYEENKSRIGGDLNSVRSQVAAYLVEQDRKRLEKELSERLRKGADIHWLINEPPAPVQMISVDDDPATGPVNAPVTIVEFTDFQCPSCGAMYPIMEEVLQSYKDRVRFVVRDYPLQQHEWALKAAEAANAAKAQGKFFEYMAILFQRQKALDVPSLKKYASELGLNRVKFDAELDKGVYAAEVKHDMSDAEIYGVSSTPSIFINGVLLKNLSADGLREAIESALAAAKKP